MADRQEDRPPRRGLTLAPPTKDPARRRKLSPAASAALDRIAARVASGEVDPDRLAAYLDEKAAEERGDEPPDDPDPEK